MKFGSSKPVSEQELVQARACLKLLKKRMASDPPTYFSQTIAPEPSSNYRKVFKPEPKATPPPAQPSRPPLKKPNNVAIDSSKGFSQYNFEGVEGAIPDNQERLECPDCNRKFLPESYDKHVNVCKKVFMTKRKEFKSSEQRDVEEAIVNKKKIDPKKPGKPPKNNKWKMQSEQFRANMRAARMATSGDEAGYQEAVKVASNYEREQLTPCPHCDRTFNEEAAKRHIPICAQKAKIAQLKQGAKPTPKGRK
jgi:uncharacterized C2H2 Zn-finger protein